MPDVKILIRPNGPYLIEGPIALTNAAGKSFDTGVNKNIALCRCGASGNKPFCDGTHAKIGFVAE